MKQILIVLLLTINVVNVQNVTAQSKCDSTLISIINVQDTAIVLCEKSYNTLLNNFNLLNNSYENANKDLQVKIDLIGKELIETKEQIAKNDKLQKRLKRKRTFLGSLIGGVTGFISAYLITK
jgi:hypothetical protein